MLLVSTLTDFQYKALLSLFPSPTESLLLHYCFHALIPRESFQVEQQTILLMATFTTIPLELRNKIYEFCLVTDIVINPYLASYERDDGVKPYCRSGQNLAISLLGVNESIQDEAATVLFGKNTWHLAFQDDQIIPQPLWRKYADYFRYLHVAFDLRDCPQKARVLYAHRSRREDGEARLRTFQEECRGEQWANWDRKTCALRMINANHLVVDVTNAFCPSGCCDLVEYILTDTSMLAIYRDSIAEQTRFLLANRDGEFKDHTHTKVVFVGMYGLKEWQLRHEKGFGCDDCPIEKGVMNPSACQWEEKGSWKLPGVKTRE